ncbi:hypothetical protein QUC32_04705 [Novosphingobium resinovorum]|uniref:Prepilin type IV endopeptidase peptidase domain-containing protein n=1 Tax=Novosphingobium resinovorum TaxID=158500 RepID=A0A031JTF9_9SPHN|nr:MULTISPECIES: hypothetical protein [Sphingomonadaceae]AOR79257.1 hypothetical protein BES08_20550 [Novosphingobium resinovorum]EJU11126.1 hypothetical protein LH128_20433 [Sphingomonas sp. LH128]EZP79657.1 hypothetical protein BV97_03814 [Novosphingobium resinovorum]MBF7014112.1 hypothetical protein [Novosphingobium sp. HR1a]WJM26253.1 hypothetical protein QUC32_04705 [Novosphingobium resinovorum]
MEAAGYFYLAFLLLVLIPVVVLPWEGRTTPDWLYMVLAASGLLGAALLSGVPGLIRACVAGAGSLAIAGLAVALLRAHTGARVLTGGQIKLLAAGATWLGFSGTFAMVAVALLTLFALAAFQKAGAVRRRPDASAILAVAIVSVAMQQHLPGM